MARKRKGAPIHGWLVLDKPEGLTSNDALGRVKWLLKPQKAGHAGTLDPLATGVLPIAFGEATKTVPFAMEGAKVYRFAIRWGRSTDTLDAEGAVTAESDARPSAEALLSVLPRFIGDVEQVPPAYSAIKVDGERAYDLARAGEVVELESRIVRIDDLKVLSTPSEDLTVLEMTCGKGAYVRAVVRDLAQALGAEGHVGALRRLKVGGFCESQAIGLERLEELVHKGEAEGGILPVETALDDIPALAVTEDDAARLRQGRAIVLLPHVMQELSARRSPLTISGEDASRWVWASRAGKAVAIGEARAGRLQPFRVFQH